MLFIVANCKKSQNKYRPEIQASQESKAESVNDKNNMQYL